MATNLTRCYDSQENEYGMSVYDLDTDDELERSNDDADCWCFGEYPSVQGVQGMYHKEANWPFRMYPWVDGRPLSYDELFPEQEREWILFEQEWDVAWHWMGSIMNDQDDEIELQFL